MKCLLILAAILFTACVENPSSPAATDCIHRFEAAETLTVLSDSTYAIGSHEYVAPPDGAVETYSRSVFMRKIVACYNEGLAIRGEMAKSEISEHVLNLCIGPDDEIASLVAGYELPKPIGVNYLGANCND